MTKPAGNLPTWNTGLANNTEPNGAKKTLGWEVNEKPASSYFNWWQNKVGEWVSYLNSLTSEVLTWTGLQTFDRKVTITPGASAGTNELGVQIQGKGTGYGMTVQGGASQPIAIQSAGTVQIVEDSPPTKNTALVDELSFRNIVKAHAHITTDGAGAITYQDGANITSVTLPGSSVIRVTMASARANSQYTVMAVGVHVASALALSCNYINRVSTTVFDISFENHTGTLVDPAAVTTQIEIIVLGP